MGEKQLLRAAVRSRRTGRMTGAGRLAGAAASTALTANLVALTREFEAARVCCFVSVRGEPETSAYLAWATASGVEVLLPRVVGSEALEWAVHSADGFETGAFDIPEPTGPRFSRGAAAADLLLIPAAAVDRSGGRLGWGRGFYDRELAMLGGSTPPVFAVVFEDEVYDRVPVEAHDAPVCGAVTEQSIHRFG